MCDSVFAVQVQCTSHAGRLVRIILFTLDHEKRKLCAKEFFSRMWSEIAFLLPLLFLLGQHPPKDRKSSKLTPQSSARIFLIRGACIAEQLSC